VEPLSATGLLLAALGVLLLLAVLLSPVSGRFGIPALLLFLLLGIAAGSEGLGGIPFDDYALAFRIGTIALVLILFDGGLNAPSGLLRATLPPAALLATVAVALTAALLAGIAIALGVPPPIAILLGAVTSSTDAAAVFAVLRSGHVRLKSWTSAVLELESGLNDPMAVILTVAITELLIGEAGGPLELVAGIGLQFLVGAGVGLAFGTGGARLLRAVPLPSAGLYPVATVALAFAIYGASTLLGGSGFLSVYLAGARIAAGRVPYEAGLRRVHDALAWLAQVVMFLALGLVVFPSRLVPLAPLGLGLALALAFVARPLAVYLCLLPFRVPWPGRHFVAWIGLRGAVPIVLAMYPVLRGVPDGDALFHLVFFAVLVNAVVPGTGVAWLARRLGQLDAAPAVPPARLELISLRDYDGSFLWYRIGEASAVADVALRDLALPAGCLLVLLLRGDRVVPPRGDTVLRPGDYACVFATPEERAFVDLVFGQPADAG
jgi:cell volume regulation protein A